jgi:hypothetical protein
MVMTDLNAISNEAAHFAQAGAIAAGGAWAYWKYVRGRTFGARADLTISATLWSSEADPMHVALAVSVSLHNSGLSRIKLAYDKKTILVDWVSHERWMLSGNELYWGPWAGTRQAVIFGDHEMVDPGEVIADDVMIPVPSPAIADQPFAYRIRAYVTRGHSWRARAFKRKQNSWVTHIIVAGRLHPRH